MSDNPSSPQPIQARKISIKAIISSILGCISVIPIIIYFVLPPSIDYTLFCGISGIGGILTIYAARQAFADIKRSQGMLSERGFASLGFVLGGFSLVVLILSIAIPVILFAWVFSSD